MSKHCSRFAAIVVAGQLLLLFPPAAVIAEELVAGKTINQSGIPLEIEGIGKASLVAIEIDGRKSDDCMVDLDSVRAQAISGLANRTLDVRRGTDRSIVVTISLKRSTETWADGTVHFTCDGPGEDCKARIIVPEAQDELLQLLR